MSVDTRRSIAYINLYLQFHQMMWEFSDLSEAEVRSFAVSLFSTELGRDYWNLYGYRRIQNDNTKRERDYDNLLDSEYRKAITSGPPEEPALDSLDTTASAGRAKIGTALLAAVAAGVITDRIIHMVRWRHSRR
jgi:hypothetical protein